MFELVVTAIARGRGIVTAEQVRDDFGRGATLLAGQAMQAGMIDLIRSTSVGSARHVARAGAQAASVLDVAREDVARWRAELSESSPPPVQAEDSRDRATAEKIGAIVAERLLARPGKA